METLHISNESELGMVAKKALALVKKKRKENHASVIALNGDLGAGKTAFTKILAREFGIDTEVTSPTFVIMKRYEIEEGVQKALPFEHLVHIDAYRIEDIDEMRPLRFGEILKEELSLICIEWAERIKELLPEHTVYMNIENGSDEESRTVTFT